MERRVLGDATRELALYRPEADLVGDGFSVADHAKADCSQWDFSFAPDRD